jgi:hypothetical protein
LGLLLLRNEAAASEIIPALSIGSSKLIFNQLGLHAVYMASVYPSEMIRKKLPFVFTTGYEPECNHSGAVSTHTETHSIL